MSSERMQILEMLEQGVISVAQATELLSALESDPAEAPETGLQEADPATEDPDGSEDDQVVESYVISETGPVARPLEAQAARSAPSITGDVLPSTPPDLAKWRRWWLYPVGIGIAVGGLSGFALYWGMQASWAWIVMACLWVPFLFGTAAFLFGLATRKSRWLHVRVTTGQEEWPQRIAISLPLPIRTTAWLLRTFGGRIPGMEGVALDEIIIALGESATPDVPLYVEVDQGDSGEKVEIYIG